MKQVIETQSVVDAGLLARFAYKSDTSVPVVSTAKKASHRGIRSPQRADESLAEYEARKLEAKLIRRHENEQAKAKRHAKIVDLAIALQVANDTSVRERIESAMHGRIEATNTEQAMQLQSAIKYFDIPASKVPIIQNGRRQSVEVANAALQGMQSLSKEQIVGIAVDSVKLGEREKGDIVSSLTQRFNGFSSPLGKRKSPYDAERIESRFTELPLGGFHVVGFRKGVVNVPVMIPDGKLTPFQRITQSAKAYANMVRHGKASHSNPLSRVRPFAYPLYDRTSNTFSYTTKPLHLPMWNQKRDVTSTIAERMEHSPSDSWSVMTPYGTSYRAMSSKGAMDARKIAAKLKLETPTELYPTVHAEYRLSMRETFERNAYLKVARPMMRPTESKPYAYATASSKVDAGFCQNGKVTFGK